jgi:GDP-L-fucose synthase
MPTNMYGPGDNFDLESSHVLPALIRKFHDATQVKAESVTLWGTGLPLREFMHSDDLASACLFLLKEYDSDLPINVGTGEDISIQELAHLIPDIIGFQGRIEWDQTKPDGTPRKLLDSTRIHALGWRPEISLQVGLASTYAWYQQNSEGKSI